MLAKLWLIHSVCLIGIFQCNGADNLNKENKETQNLNNGGGENQGRHFKDPQLRMAAEALTDDEISEIVKSIAQPNVEEITEDMDLLQPRLVAEVEVQPRQKIVTLSPPLSNVSESRMLSMKSWNKLIRKLMRQIRKGTRKIQRKTRVKKRAKKLKEEPTLESFLQRMYVINQEQRLKKLKKKKLTSSWFSW